MGPEPMSIPRPAPRAEDSRDEEIRARAIRRVGLALPVLVLLAAISWALIGPLLGRTEVAPVVSVLTFIFALNLTAMRAHDRARQEWYESRLEADLQQRKGLWPQEGRPEWRPSVRPPMA